MREHQTVSGCTVTWPCYISVGECIFCCCSGFPFAVLINLTKYCIVFVILQGLLVVIIRSSCRTIEFVVLTLNCLCSLCSCKQEENSGLKMQSRSTVKRLVTSR